MTWMLLFCLSIISGVCYRLGGWEHGNKLFRWIGCSVITTLSLLLLYKFNWWYLAHLAALAGTLTTYVGKKKGKDATWLTWLLTGLCYGLCAVFVAIAYGCWWGFAIRALVLASLTMVISVWNKPIWKFDSATVTEFCRGFLIPATLVYLLIGVVQ